MILPFYYDVIHILILTSGEILYNYVNTFYHSVNMLNFKGSSLKITQLVPVLAFYFSHN